MKRVATFRSDPSSLGKSSSPLTDGTGHRQILDAARSPRQYSPGLQSPQPDQLTHHNLLLIAAQSALAVEFGPSCHSVNIRAALAGYALPLWQADANLYFPPLGVWAKSGTSYLGREPWQNHPQTQFPCSGRCSSSCACGKV